jgi:hypothetical protein
MTTEIVGVELDITDSAYYRIEKRLPEEWDGKY